MIYWLGLSNNITETYLVGTLGMKEMLEAAGVNTSSNSPQYVVLGYDMKLPMRS